MDTKDAEWLNGQLHHAVAAKDRYEMAGAGALWRKRNEEEAEYEGQAEGALNLLRLLLDKAARGMSLTGAIHDAIMTTTHEFESLAESYEENKNGATD